MASIKIEGTGFGGYGYKVFIDDKERQDVQKIDIHYSAEGLTTAEVTFVVNALDLMGDVDWPNLKAIVLAKP